MKTTVASMLAGLDRFNPSNIPTLECYVNAQTKENAYDLEANLALLKMYQFTQEYNPEIVALILLKALTNFPHTDFILCKCLLNEKLCNDYPIKEIIILSGLLEKCEFQEFWNSVTTMKDVCSQINGFHDSIRKFVCHVVGITFQTIQKPLLTQLLGGVDDVVLRQWVNKYGWREESNGVLFIANQDESIKTKNITESIDFESVAEIMAIIR